MIMSSMNKNSFMVFFQMWIPFLFIYDNFLEIEVQLTYNILLRNTT